MSILEKLSYDEGRVVTVEVSKDKKTVELEEACDSYFSVNLNKEEFGVLIDELKAMHEQMIDS